MTLFYDKMPISHRCVRGLMLNLIKKSWTVSTTNLPYDKSRRKKQEWQKICCDGIFKITLGNMTLNSHFFIKEDKGTKK